MMNKSLRASGAESSHNAYYGFQRLVMPGRMKANPGPCEDACAGVAAEKKEPPFPAAFEVDNREASNRVDRSHSVSKQGQTK
jgi:hypothetical protein